MRRDAGHHKGRATQSESLECSPGAPLSVAAIKSLARQTENRTFAESMAGIEAGKFAAYKRMLSSQDAREDPRAFAEKRKPVWRGR